MMKRMTHNWLPTTASVAVFTISACNNSPAPIPDNGLVPESPAIVALKQEIQSYPDSTLLYDKLIGEYNREHKYVVAAAWCDTLLKKDPEKNFSYWLDKGDLLRSGGQYDSAITAYKNFLVRFPDDEQVLLNLANAQAEAGYPESLQLSERIMVGYPTAETRSDAYFIQGMYYSRVKKYDSAIAHYDKAITNRITFWEAHLEKGIAYYDSNEFEKALKTFDQLKQANPSYPDVYYWIGKCNEVLKNKGEALKNYEMAYGLDRSFTNAKLKIDSLNSN
jgi:tetratricopeptide (TPR) repeat protein